MSCSAPITRAGGSPPAKAARSGEASGAAPSARAQVVGPVPAHPGRGQVEALGVLAPGGGLGGRVQHRVDEQLEGDLGPAPVAGAEGDHRGQVPAGAVAGDGQPVLGAAQPRPRCATPTGWPRRRPRPRPASGARGPAGSRPTRPPPARPRPGPGTAGRRCRASRPPSRRRGTRPPSGTAGSLPGCRPAPAAPRPARAPSGPRPRPPAPPARSGRRRPGRGRPGPAPPTAPPAAAGPMRPSGRAGPGSPAAGPRRYQARTRVGRTRMAIE